MSVLQPLALNLQSWRLRRGLSVSALARKAGISKSTLSELERGNGNPSLDTLWALAEALNVPFGFLFTERGGPDAVRVVRGDEAPVVSRYGDDFVSRLMVGWQSGGEVEIYEIELAHGVRREARSHGEGVTEHTIVIEGRVDVGLDGESAELAPGDLITFPADQPHHYEAVGGPARIISIHQYPPVARAAGQG